ncbi:MAG: glycosyltransferase [Acidimicrobiia bacterium]|nr:glycosyltransferase [Acidimicrobiia bacterium]
MVGPIGPVWSRQGPAYVPGSRQTRGAKVSARPTISIGVPVYNGENFLEDALRSLQGQSFEDFEVVVSDNASTDATGDIAARFAAEDPRFRYLRNERNLGANPNYNRTFALARGEYFRWHAHDDVCEPKYLERCHDVLAADRTAVLVHTRTSYIDRNGDPLVPMSRGFLDPDGYIERLGTDEGAPALLGDARPHVRLDAIVNRLSVFFDVFGLARVEDLRRTLLLPSYYGADKVFLAELAVQGRLVRLDEPGFSRRCHASASTRSASLKDLAKWSDAAQSGAALYPALMVRGYLGAIRNADLRPGERRRCYAVVAKRAANPYKLLRGR